MRLLQPTLLVTALLLPGAAITYRSSHLVRAQTAQGAQTPCCGQPDTTAPREIDFPYYSLRDGFNSTLLLVSASPKALTSLLPFIASRVRQCLRPP